MGKSEENLKAAFAGESQANRKYLAFAKKADKEGLANVARLFRAAAESETVHALSHLNVLGGIKGTAENLQEAIDGETHEFTEMYPKMIKEAEAEGNSQAKMSFNGANEAEKLHADFYKKALEAVESGKDIEAGEFFVCQVCGHTVKGSPPENCPVCGVPKEKFKKTE